MQTAENLRAGMPPARLGVRLCSNSATLKRSRKAIATREDSRLLETLVRDTRHVLRRLRMAPSFTAATVLTLALGIGATTSIFTLVHAVLLKSLPVANPAELLRLGRESHCCYLGGYSQQDEWSIVSYDLYKYLRDNTKGFAELAAFQDLTPILGVRRSGRFGCCAKLSERIRLRQLLQDVRRSDAYAGRTLTPADDQPNAPPAAVMSYRLWQERYQSDPSVIGAVFNLDDKPFTIVGIAPPGFFGDTLRNPPPDFFAAEHRALRGRRRGS